MQARRGGGIRALWLLLSALALPSGAGAQEIRVTLLGTGSPPPSRTRLGPATLVRAGDQTLVFDAGRGVAQQLRQLAVPFADIDAVFLTHLHSDHVVGLPDLWLSGWLVGRRTLPLRVFGPTGTAEMATHLAEAFAFDVRVRTEHEHAAPGGGRLSGSDVVQGVVYDSGGVKVTAFEVDHGAARPAFGYRIEYGGHVVVLSGDTRYSENLIAFSRGADLLIHEVILSPPGIQSTDPRYSIYALHTAPEEAARVFGSVRPKLAVFSHIVSLWGLPDSDLTRRTALSYPGPVLVGEDLMGFVVGDEVRLDPARPE